MQNDQPQYQPPQVSESPQAEGAASKNSKTVAILGVLVVLLIAVTGFIFINWQKSKSQLKTSQAQLKTSHAELAAKDSELIKATAQLITYRDEARKTDLASFVNAVRAYNAKNHTHLTTEGSLAESIYKTQLSPSIANFKDPKTGDIYDFVAVAKVQTPPPLKVGTIQYQWAGKCGTKALEDASDESLSAAATLLENGTMYCLQI